MTTTMTSSPATPKQIAFLKTLAAERPMWADVENMHADNIERLTKAQASSCISDALKVPKETKTATTKPKASGGLKIDSDGMYQTPDGTIYRVQLAKQGSGKLYAKRLAVTAKSDGSHIGSFVYAPGAVYLLEPEDKMTMEQAKSFGKLYNVCCVCAAALTDEVSIAEGIGPVCGGRVKSKKVWFKV